MLSQGTSVIERLKTDGSARYFISSEALGTATILGLEAFNAPIDRFV